MVVELVEIVGSMYLAMKEGQVRQADGYPHTPLLIIVISLRLVSFRCPSNLMLTIMAVIIEA